MTDDKSETAKEAMLHHLTGQINTHASTFVGLSIILFAYLDVVVKRLEPIKFVSFPICITSTALQYFIVFMILWFLVTLLVFEAFRLIFYGRFAHKTIIYPEDTSLPPANSIKELWTNVNSQMKNNRLWIIPMDIFEWGIEKGRSGLLFSGVLGFFICLLLVLTFLFSL